MTTKGNGYSQELWEILEIHPGFRSLSERERDLGYLLLEEKILSATEQNPISVAEAAAELDRIFDILDLVPLAEAQGTAVPRAVDKPAISGEAGALRVLTGQLQLGAARDAREAGVDAALLNTDSGVELQRSLYRTGWDEALLYAQNKLREALDSGSGDQPAD